MTDPLQVTVERAVAAVLRDPRSASGAQLFTGGWRAPAGGRGRHRPGIIVDAAGIDARNAADTAHTADSTNSADARRAPGETGDTGQTRTPVAVKDNIDVAGLVTGMGGPLGRHRARHDSTVWARLRGAGGAFAGHTAMPELAWGVLTPGCPNPWGPNLTPGGSSGGSGAAVAAGIVPLALGTDTGGSVRIPAALCGVAGLRPTAGSTPMTGVAPMAPTLDTVGTLAETAARCVAVLEIIAGPGDPAPTTAHGLRVGIPDGWRGRVSEPVADAVDAAAEALRGAGVATVPVRLGSAGLASATAYVIMLIEAARIWLAQAERDPAAVDPGVLAKLRAGGRIDADPALYPAALRLAAAIRAETETALHEGDLAAILLPTVAAAGVRDDQRSVRIGDREVPVDDALARYTAVASVAGLPALSVPVGLATAGTSPVPVGVQLIGRARGERTLALLAGPIERGPGFEVARARAHLSHGGPS